MRRVLLALASAAFAVTVVAPAFGQNGLRVDPRLHGQFGAAPASAWGSDAASDPIGAARYALVPPSWRLAERAAFGLSYGGSREPDSYGLGGFSTSDPNGVSMSGQYWLSPAWAVSAGAATGDGVGLQPRHQFRFGVLRQF